MKRNAESSAPRPACERQTAVSNSGQFALTPYGDDTPDCQFVADVLRGDPVSVQRFVDRMQCVPKVLAARNVKLGRPLTNEDLADLTQDVLVIIWKKLGKFPEFATLESWAYQICVFELLNLVRKRNRQRDLAQQASAELPIATDNRRFDSYEDLHLGLATLEKREAEIIRLRHFEELSFATASDRMDVASSTAKTWYYRGLAKLQEFLENRAKDAKGASVG